MSFRTCRLTAISFLTALAALSTANPAAGQATQSGTPHVRESRVDIFAGYSYYAPSHADINNINRAPSTRGALFSVSGYFNRYLGLQAEGGIHPPQDNPNACVYTGQAGPIVRYQLRRFVPYGHALAGGAKLGGPSLQPCKWGYGFTTGAGVDYILPVLNDHLAIRLVQADFNYDRVDYGTPGSPIAYTGGLQKAQALGLNTGLVLRFGDILPPPAVAMSCVANPGSVFPGDPLTVNSNTVNLSPKRKTEYTWTSTGGKVTGTGETVQVATAGLAPGSYVVNGRVSQGSKVYQQGTCSAEFQVKPYEPPTITCSANPSSIHQGETSTITASGNSPQGRALTYSFSSSAGQINGQGATAQLTGAGPAPATVTVTCNVVDDLGKTASTTTTVQVVANAVPPAPAARALCSIDFARDKKRPVRVNNEAKACLDDIAITLQRESDSRLVMTGNDASGETVNMAAERASNAKLYLTREKGIDPARITLQTGSAGDRTVTSMLVPAGATPDTTGTQPVAEDSIKHHGQPYGVPRKRK